MKIKEIKNINDSIMELIDKIPKSKTDCAVFISTYKLDKENNHLDTAIIGMPDPNILMIIEALTLNTELAKIMVDAIYNFLQLKENKHLLESFKLDLENNPK